MSLPNVNVKDGVKRALRDDDGLGGKSQTKWATDDATTHDKLDTIAGALGVGDTTAAIFNVTVAVANVEQSQALPADTKRFIVKARGKSKIQLAYVSGESNTTYVTIPPGAVFEDPNFYSSQTIYFLTNKAGETVEIIAYS